MVVRLRNKNVVLPRLYQDCIVHVEAISLIEEEYLWHNVQVYAKDSSSMEEFLILHSPSFYCGGKSLSAYMTAHKRSTIQEFANILDAKKDHRAHLETSTEAKRVEELIPWLTQS